MQQLTLQQPTTPPEDTKSGGSNIGNEYLEGKAAGIKTGLAP
jgi:hypothetical protein